MSSEAASAADGVALPPPTNALVNPMLTDMYQLTMAYAYWKSGKHEEASAFDLYFRKNPFHGEFTIFAGLEECLRFVSHFKFSPAHIEYLRSVMPEAAPDFFTWLASTDCSQVKLYAVAEGTVVFPRVPVIRVEGPLAVCQLLETTLLTLVNFASLMTTNAARYRVAAGPEKQLLEFGLRRAQGPDGGMSASRYSYMGGFDASSNALAGFTFGIPVRGTHAHAFVSSFTSLEEVKERELNGVDLVEAALRYRRECAWQDSNESELAAFISYAQSFPSKFLALVDTYDTLQSGVPNFLAVALALNDAGYQAVGVRLDSGDLAYLSRETRRLFRAVAEKQRLPFIAHCNIVASNDINEDVLHSLNEQGHEVDTFGIGTNLVTCQAQPALGMVYKLVEINGHARIKLSQEISKVTIPGRKDAFRLVGKAGTPLLDIMLLPGEAPPAVGSRLLCRHPFEEKKRVYVTPAAIIPLHQLVWDGAAGAQCKLPSLDEVRAFVAAQLASLREDHLRHLNPTPYKVSVSNALYEFIHAIWMREVPVPEIE